MVAGNYGNRSDGAPILMLDSEVTTAKRLVAKAIEGLCNAVRRDKERKK